MVKKDLSENLDGREPVMADHREVSQQERIAYAKDPGKKQTNKQINVGGASWMSRRAMGDAVGELGRD